MSRQFTKKEMRDEFIAECDAMINYWAKGDKDCADKIRGAVFSIFVLLDGESGFIPGYALIPTPHPDDKKYCVKNKENYYPEPPQILIDKYDIRENVELHHEFSKVQMQAIEQSRD